ncbi:hypothetical protein MMC22_008150 [Lobaria immixta]|nr:hypothetical protein [Lobaria immixta]
MHFSTILLLSLTTAPFIHALSLFDSLRTSAGASQFADFVEGDPILSAIYLSGVRTVFAPSDEYFPVTNATLLKRNESVPTSSEQRKAEYQATYSDCQINNAGSNFTMYDNNTIVVDQSPAPGTLTRRALPPSRPRNSSTFPPLRIFSGLGNNVSVIRGDIPYDGGLIQVTDGFFTLPQPLSTTATQTGNTVFANAVDAANLMSTLEVKQDITIFVPRNAAFLSSNSSSPPNLSYHVLTGFVGYLPLLVDGASFRTRTGTNITVRVSGDDTFINDARIVHANLVLPNGVAHVLDRVLTPPSTSPVLFSGTSSPVTSWETVRYIIGAWSVALSVMLVL